MKLLEAIPVLIEFGYFREHVFSLDYVCQYGDGYNHMRQCIRFEVIESCKNQQELRKLLFEIYNRTIKKIKSMATVIPFKTIIPEYLTINEKENDE